MQGAISTARRRGVLKAAQRVRRAPRGSHDCPDFAGALVVGLLATISRLDREHGNRLLDHLENVLREHRLRRLEGDAAAHSWLISQLQQLELPDRRKWRTLQDDVILVKQYDALQRQLRPIFRELSSDARKRLQRAAPIVSAIIGRPKPADQLPTNPKLAQFCQEILNVTGVTLSRARLRVAQGASAKLSLIRKRLKLFKRRFRSIEAANVAELAETTNAVASRLRQISPRHLR